MKKLLLMVLALLLCNCGTDIYYMTDGLTTDVDNLLDYNIIFQHDGKGVCGGTIISSDQNTTCVITAAHCISLRTPMSIEVNDGSSYNVELIDANIVSSDLALLCTEVDMPVQIFSHVPYTEPEVAEDVWTLGYPARMKDAVSRGIVSKLNTTGHYGRPMNYFDVTVWYGSSGSGIFNKYGELVGVVSQFGNQFDVPEPHGAETGWVFGCRIREIRRLLKSIGVK